MNAKERAGFEEELQELRKAAETAEARTARLPYNADTEPLRATMTQLVSELRRMEQNIVKLLDSDEAGGE